MRILVLGAAGFIGARLVQALASAHRTAQIIASDLRAGPPGSGNLNMGNVEFIAGDIMDPALFADLFERRVDAVFHLAATLTFDSENSFERGVDINVHALMRLLEACRVQGNAPKFIFASSISTFGGALPEVVDDYVRQTPQTSYGTHKVIGEQLINDYSRRGYLDGRSLRLPIVLTHPGPPSRSVSDRIASLIREPLSGESTLCPISPHTPLAVTSVDKVIEGMLKLLDIPADVFSHTRAMNLPSITITPRQIADAVARRMPNSVSVPIKWDIDQAVQTIVESWPSRFTSKQAIHFGLTPDHSVDSIIDAFLLDRSRMTAANNGEAQ